MGAFAATVLAILLWLMAAPAGADQTDARLDRLFDQLHDVGDAKSARSVELVIWNIWAEHDDNAVRVLLDKGVQAMNRGDHRKALESFDQIVAIAPDFAEGWNKRATVHYLLRDYQESLRDIERTLALEPRHFGALSGRGLVYAALEELDLALESFEAALAVHPHLVGARINAEAIRRSLKEREI